MSEPASTQKQLIVNKTEGEHLLEVIGVGAGVYSLFVYLTDEAGYTHVVEVQGQAAEGSTDAWMIDLATGTVTEESKEVEFDRDAFIALVKAATADEKKGTQRFFVKRAHKIFDNLEDGHERRAMVRLYVFKKLLKAKRISHQPLTDAIAELLDRVKQDCDGKKDNDDDKERKKNKRGDDEEDNDDGDDD